MGEDFNNLGRNGGSPAPPSEAPEVGEPGSVAAQGCQGPRPMARVRGSASPRGLRRLFLREVRS